MFSLRFMSFPTFLENKIFQGEWGCKTNFVVLAAEPVGRRSLATELPCYIFILQVIYCIFLSILYIL